MNNQKKNEDGMPKVKLKNTTAQTGDLKLGQEDIQESNEIFLPNVIFFKDPQPNEPNQPNDPFLISLIPQQQCLRKKAQNNQQSPQTPSSSIIERMKGEKIEVQRNIFNEQQVNLFNKQCEENNIIQQQIQKHTLNTFNQTHHETSLLEQDYKQLKGVNLIPDAAKRRMINNRNKINLMIQLINRNHQMNQISQILQQRRKKGLVQLHTENIDFNDPDIYSLDLFARFEGLYYCKRKIGLHIIKYSNLAKIKRSYFELFGFNLMYLVIFKKDEEFQIVFYKLHHEQCVSYKNVQQKFDQEVIIVQQPTTQRMLKSIEKNCKVLFNRQKYLFWKANNYTIDNVRSDINSYQSQQLAIRFRNVKKIDEFLKQLALIKNFSGIITENKPNNILISSYSNGQEIIVIISFDKIQEFNFLDYFECFTSFYDVRQTNDLIDNKKLKQLIAKYHWDNKADFQIQDLEWLTHDILEKQFDQLNARDIPQFEDVFVKIDLYVQP